MNYEFEAMRDRGYESLSAMAHTIDTSEAEPRYLDRLVKDRDELIYSMYAVGITVLELSTRTGIPWPQIFDVVDRVREERRSKSPFSALGGM